MSEKSGLEMIKEICQKITALEYRFTNVEQMMKELLNRANGFEKLPINTSITPSTNSVKINVIPAENITQQKVEPKSNKTKVLGQIKNKEGKFVSGVNVKIFNTNNQVIKETRTNKAGEWVCFLPSSKYRAEYFLENMVNGEVNFSVLPGQTMVRVAQQKEV